MPPKTPTSHADLHAALCARLAPLLQQQKADAEERQAAKAKVTAARAALAAAERELNQFDQRVKGTADDAQAIQSLKRQWGIIDTLHVLGSVDARWTEAATENHLDTVLFLEWRDAAANNRTRDSAASYAAARKRSAFTPAIKWVESYLKRTPER